MDNLTHSLVGYTIAKVAKHSNNSSLNKIFENKKHSFFLFFTSIFAANFPDLDLIYNLYDPSALGYLVHHRGHTHTFIYAIPQTLLALIFFSIIFRIKDKSVLLVGFILVLVNICVHISLDALNMYGVHPFYPFDNRWYYGDRVFIIEPWIWFSLLPIALTPFKKINSLKTLYVVFFITIIVLAFKIKMLVLGTSIFLVLYFLTLLYFYQKIEERTKVFMSLGFVFIFLLSFMVEGVRTEKFLSHAFSETSEYANITQEKLVEYVISPYPGNPFCWDILVIRTNEHDGYFVGWGRYQSSQVFGFECPDGMNRHKEPILSELSLKTSDNVFNLNLIKEVMWSKDYVSSQKIIFTTKNDCRLEAWFQFVRVPYLTDSGDYIDLRFSDPEESRRRDFTRLNLDTYSDGCVRMPAPWVSPRKDLLDKSKQDL